MREVVDHYFPDCETSYQLKFKLESGMPNGMINQLCDGQMNFLSVMELISNFEDTNVYHASIIEFFIDKSEYFQLLF